MALIDHDALAESDGAERALGRVPESGLVAVYRGWMLASSRYAALAYAAAAKGIALTAWMDACPTSRRLRRRPELLAAV